MTLDEFFDGSGYTPHGDGFSEFYSSLYRILESKKDESPSVDLFFKLIREAYTTAVEEEIQAEEIWTAYKMDGQIEDDFERLKQFILTEIHYFKTEYEPGLSQFYYINCDRFLKEENNRRLFQSSSASWNDFLTLLKTLSEYNIHERISAQGRLQSADPISTLIFITQNSQKTPSISDLAFLAWLAEKWRLVYTHDRLIYSHQEGFNYYRTNKAELLQANVLYE